MPRLIPRRLLPVVLLTLLLSVSDSFAARAQIAPRVTVALVNQLADSALAAIVRAPGSQGRTLVLLRESDASPLSLASAMMAVFQIRRALGDSVRSRMVFKVYGKRGAGSMPPNESRLANYYFGRLRSARGASLDSLGVVRSVDLAIAPAPQPRGR
jgi:hypothetical protein